MKRGGGLALGVMNAGAQGHLVDLIFLSLLLSNLELSDTKFYERKKRALLRTASHYCEAVGCGGSTTLLLSAGVAPDRTVIPSLRFACTCQTPIENIGVPRSLETPCNSEAGHTVIASWRFACTYRGTSLIRNRHPVGPYSGTMPRALWGS